MDNQLDKVVSRWPFFMPEPEGWRHQGVYFISSSNVSECHLLKRLYKLSRSIKIIPGNLQSVVT